MLRWGAEHGTEKHGRGKTRRPAEYWPDILRFPCLFTSQQERAAATRGCQRSIEQRQGYPINIFVNHVSRGKKWSISWDISHFWYISGKTAFKKQWQCIGMRWDTFHRQQEHVALPLFQKSKFLVIHDPRAHLCNKKTLRNYKFYMQRACSSLHSHNALIM